MNLLVETIHKLEKHGKTPAHVLYCAIELEKPYWFSWEQFESVANRDGSVKDALIICGDHWWLERQECDGIEWWEFKQLPEKPENRIEELTAGHIFYYSKSKP